MSGLTWVHSDEVPWNIRDLQRTILFAAQRMMEMLPLSTQCRKDMVLATKCMCRCSPTSDKGEILFHVRGMYTASTEIHTQAIMHFGNINKNVWTAVFLEYQGMISCAQRQLEKEVEVEKMTKLSKAR